MAVASMSGTHKVGRFMEQNGPYRCPLDTCRLWPLWVVGLLLLPLLRLTRPFFLTRTLIPLVDGRAAPSGDKNRRC